MKTDVKVKARKAKTNPVKAGEADIRALLDDLPVFPLDMDGLNRQLSLDIRTCLKKGVETHAKMVLPSDSVSWRLPSESGLVLHPGRPPLLVDTECVFRIAECVVNSHHNPVVVFKAFPLYETAGECRSILPCMEISLPLSELIPFKKPAVTLKEFMGENFDKNQRVKANRGGLGKYLATGK